VIVYNGVLSFSSGLLKFCKILLSFCMKVSMIILCWYWRTESIAYVEVFVIYLVCLGMQASF